MIPAGKFVIVLITCASKKEAQIIAGILLKKRLAACANIVAGVQSKFWWRGRIDSAKEALLILKAKAGNFERIENTVKGIHSYEVPEIIAAPIVKGSREYLEWLRSC